MSLTFPASPTVGDTYTVGARTWAWSGTIWEITGTTAAAGSIGATELASSAVTTAKIATEAVTQAKLAANVSGITITTTANRDTDITSPFTGQFCFLTDTSLLQRYTGSAWIVAIASDPAAPTALSGTALSTSVSIAFTPGAENGSAITNYQYALSTDSGSTYGSFVALDPADATSPITISGLTASTTYTIKLKAVNTMGAGTESAGVSVTTIAALTVDYLVIAGGGSGGGGNNGNDGGGGGGAGGMRSTVTATGGGGTLESALSPTLSTNYTVTVGAGAAFSAQNVTGTDGVNSVFSTITSTGGGGGGMGNANGRQGGSGGGAGGGGTGGVGGAAVSPTQGFPGRLSGDFRATGSLVGGGGGGAGATAATQNGTNAARPNGGAGLASSITGSSVFYAGGGGGGGGTGGNPGNTLGGTGGTGGGGAGGDNAGSGEAVAGTANFGGGGGGGRNIGGTQLGGAGGSGVVILRYPSVYTITIGAGLTGTTATVSSNKVTTITAGSGNVSWSA